MKTLLLSLLVMAQSVVSLREGTRTDLKDLTNQGRIVIVTDADCVPCQKYTRILRGCSNRVKDRLTFASISTPAKSKAMKLPGEVYLLKDSENFSTPTTLIGENKMIGPQTCESLAAEVSL